jgi:hypothetical protein
MNNLSADNTNLVTDCYSVSAKHTYMIGSYPRLSAFIGGPYLCPLRQNVATGLSTADER